MDYFPRKSLSKYLIKDTIYSKLAVLTSDYLLLVRLLRLLITQWYLVPVSWSMVYIVLVKHGYFWCIMGALRDSLAPIPPRFTTDIFQ